MVDLDRILSKSLLPRSSRFFVGLCDPAGSSKDVRCFSELEAGCGGGSSSIVAAVADERVGAIVVLTKLTSSKVEVTVCDIDAPEIDSFT